MVKKQGIGRKKIEIKKIENKRSLEVTFSKRRTGLYKKVDNLCTLCDAEAAVIVFSYARRPYVFGHPLVDSVIDRFLHKDTHSSPSVGHGQRQCLEAPKSLQVKREREEATRIGNREDGFWWDAPIENMGLFELEHFKASIEELRKKVTVLVEGKMMMESVHCNATVEYTTPPQSQLQFQFQPHDQDSSLLLDGLFELEHYKAPIQEFREKVMVLVEEKTMMMESVHCNATVEYATPPQSQFQLQFQCQPHKQDFFPLFDGVLYGFVQCQPHD